VYGRRVRGTVVPHVAKGERVWGVSMVSTEKGDRRGMKLKGEAKCNRGHECRRRGFLPEKSRGAQSDVVGSKRVGKDGEVWPDKWSKEGKGGRRWVLTSRRGLHTSLCRIHKSSV